jgi:aminopeptidase N
LPGPAEQESCGPAARRNTLLLDLGSAAPGLAALPVPAELIGGNVQTAEITRDETSERARLLRVGSYDIELDLTRGEDVFGSVSVITFDCASPGASTHADLVAQTVHEITLNGSPVDPAAAYANGRIALTGLAAHNELRVVADCAYGSGGTGLQRSADSADGRVYTFTDFAPAQARTAFANFDQPDLKAAFTFHILVPDHWVVISNQPAPEPVPAGPGRSVWHFPATPRISTYLVAVAAGEYHVLSESHTTPAGQVIPIGLACRQSMLPHLEAPEVLGLTRAGLDYFTGLFGMSYPFAKYDQVFVPDNVGAMENVGCVTITESLLFRSAVTDTMREVRAMVILHEMSHQWFGDLVTMKWWEDLWLNESFAELAGFQATVEATRFTGAWTTFCGGEKSGAYTQDQLPSTHPIAADVATLSEAEANFDGISYAKGAAVLKQLVAYLGRDNFFAGIASYFAAHEWANATLADLLHSLEASSGRSLAEWSKAWLETAGPNTLRPAIAVDDEGRFTEFAVLQEASAAHPVLRPHHIAIGLYNTDAGGRLVRTHRVETDIAGPRTSVPALAGLARPDLVLLNDDDLTYAIIRFDDRSLRTLTGSIGRFADALPRTICWSAVMDMANQAELPVPAFVALLVSGMGDESAIAVLEGVHATAERLLAQSADPAWVPAGKSLLATEGVRLLLAAEPGSDHQLAWAQMLGWTATTAGQLDFVAGLLDGTVSVPGLAVDTELRWRLLCRLAVTGRAGDAQIDAELSRDPTDAGRRHATACRAAIGDAGHKAAAWRLLTGSSELGLEDTVEVARAFNAPEHAEQLRPYAGKYFQTLPEVWARQSGMLRLVFAPLLFPYTAGSPDLLRQVDGLLGQPDLDPALARAVAEGRDVVEKALRSRQTPGSTD